MKYEEDHLQKSANLITKTLYTSMSKYLPVFQLSTAVQSSPKQSNAGQSNAEQFKAVKAVKAVQSSQEKFKAVQSSPE